MLYLISCNTYILNCYRLFNVFHYYIKENRKMSKEKRVQGIMMTHLY